MKRILGIAGLAAMLSTSAFADPADGVWKTAPGDTGGFLYVTVGACGTEICGTITGAVDKDGKDDPKYEHLGKPILWNMTAAGDGSYAGGTIWAPDTDKKYSSKMTLNGTVLTVKGCVLGGLICRGQDWTRTK